MSLTSDSVYVIIPVHNRRETTIKCLHNLSDSGDLQRYQIVIVDDGSTDGTADKIHAIYPDVTVLQGDGNLWWTGGIAVGMKYAFEQGAHYIIWLNDDCIPMPNTLPGLINFLRVHPKSFAAPTCYEGDLQSDFIKHNGFKSRRGCAAKPGEVLEVDGTSGWCVAMPAEVVAKVGLPDTKKFPHYSGDDMYTLKMTRSGYQAYLLGDLSLILFGSVHEHLCFKDYFKPGISNKQIFLSLFWDKKSPYRLPTQFFVLVDRYSAAIGIPFFLFKLFIWLFEFCKIRITLEFKKDGFMAQ